MKYTILTSVKSKTDQLVEFEFTLNGKKTSRKFMFTRQQIDDAKVVGVKTPRTETEAIKLLVEGALENLIK